MLVKDCMTKDLITISAREDVHYGFYLLKKHNIRQLPVTNNGYIYYEQIFTYNNRI